MIATMMVAERRKLEYNSHMALLLDRSQFSGNLTKFARAANMSYSQAHDMMVNGVTDGRRLGTLKKAALALGVSLTQLIEGK